MSDAPLVGCPHCYENVSPADFCSACGMALPSTTPSSPRVISRKSIATTAVGQQLQSAELLNSARQAARSLLSIGIINLAFGALNLYLLMTLFSGRKPLYLEATTASMLIAGALYVGMYYWAKFMPLAAAITGLCVYIAKWGVDFAIQNLQHSSVSNSSTSNYQWVRIIMVIYLFRGVAAGLRHRKLERDQRQAAPMPVLPVE